MRCISGLSLSNTIFTRLNVGCLHPAYLFICHVTLAHSAFHAIGAHDNLCIFYILDTPPVVGASILAFATFYRNAALQVSASYRACPPSRDSRLVCPARASVLTHFSQITEFACRARTSTPSVLSSTHIPRIGPPASRAAGCFGTYTGDWLARARCMCECRATTRYSCIMGHTVRRACWVTRHSHVHGFGSMLLGSVVYS